MPLREMWVIAKREFMERVRTKWFIVMTLLWPVLMVGMLVVPALIGGQTTAGAKVVIIDQTGELAGPMKFELSVLLKWDMIDAAPDADVKALRARIKANQINGYVMIPKDAVDGGEIIYSGDNASNQTVGILFSKAAQIVIVSKRAQRAGLSDIDLALIKRPVNVSVRHTTGEEEGASGTVMFVIGYLIALFIYIAITLFGVGVMRSVVTEKSNKVIELLVAATSPRAMMSGKIIGVGAAGLLQISVWFIFGAILTSQQDAILGLFGVAPKGPSVVPSLTTGQIAVVLVFFLFGYLFYSAMYAAVGAMVSNEQDSQQAQMPVTFMLVIGILSLMAVTNDPRGQTAVVMTMVPFWSPMLMPLRYFMGGATLSQVGVSLAILAVSTVVIARAAAKIYRVGILMYGKRPGLREVIRWLRYDR
jgi:ABC-2 type transport system permease protein